MEQDVSILSLLLNWFPMLLLIGVWIVFMRKGLRSRNGKSSADLMEDYLVEMRKQNAVLERMAQNLESRIQRLEAERRA